MPPAARNLEGAQLQRGLNDLVGLLALSHAWAGCTPSHVAQTLCDALLEMLHLDWIFIALEGEGAEPGMVATARSGSSTAGPGALRAQLNQWLGDDRRAWPPVSRPCVEHAELSLATFQLGTDRDFGTMVASSRRPDFPDAIESLILNVASNQTLVALQEKQLRREQQRLAGAASATALIEGIPGLVAVLDPDGRVQRVNRQIEEYCGRTIEGLREWGTNGTVHPEDMSHVTEVFGRSIASGTPYIIEQRLRRFDGEYRWFDNRGRPLRDADGIIQEWHVLLTDIDDRKRAEDAVRASELNLRQQSETFPQMLWSATAEGHIDYCNDRLLSYSGMSAETVTGGGWVNLLHPEDREPTAAIWLRCVASGEPYSVEVRHFHEASGAHRWNLTTAVPLRDGDDRIVKWYGSCVDIHDRKLAEEALKGSERHLAQLIDTIPAYLFSAGPDGAVNYLNPQIREWFGRTEEKIMAAEWVHLVHPEDRDGTVQAWMGAVAAGKPYRREVRFLHRSGEYRWCDNGAMPLRDSEGRILAWHGVVNDIHDRKLAEDALKASEQNLRLTIDTVPALVWSARTDGAADFFNQHYLDFVGRQPEHLREWQWTSLVHPDDLPVISGAWDACRTSGTTGVVEARMRRHDGVYRWFLFQTNPLRDDNGDVVKWYGVNTDIEDRKRAEEALAARERTLREALDHLSQAQRLSQTGSFTTDVKADAHVWSEELYRILEYAPEDRPTFRAFRDRIHEDDRPAFDAGFQRSMADQSEFDQVFRILTPKGNLKYLHAVAHFVAGSADRPTVIGSIQDITRSRQSEEELRRSEYLLATAERISETGSFSWDMDNNKLLWSTQMYRIHELDEGLEPVYPNLLATVHPDDVDMIDERTKRAFQGEGSPDDGYRLLMPDGRIKYLRTAFRVIRHDDGRLESIGVAQDVTQRRIAENALDELRSELAHITRVTSLGELAASIAHEVNQPLSGIITNASTCLRMLALDPPDIEGAIKTAQRSMRDGNRASEVISRLRGLYRKQDFTPEPLDLNEAAQEVIAICSHDLQRRRVALAVTYSEALPAVLGDRIQLQQVILNLVLNAADAIEELEGPSRRISIETALTADGAVQLAVRDTGSGIGAEHLGRIFEPFFTTKPNGMGIGLSVSKSIIERHDGTLWARSNDGAGATLGFSLPSAPSAGIEQPATSVQPSDGEGL